MMVKYVALSDLIIKLKKNKPIGSDAHDVRPSSGCRSESTEQ